MKIGIITDETDTKLLGLGTYTLNIAKHILTQDKKNEYVLIHRKKEAYDIYRMAKEIIIPSPKFPISIVRNFIGMPLKLKKYKFDIVYHTGSVGPFLFKHFLPGKKNMQTVLDIIPVLHPETYELSVRMAFKHLLPRAIKNADYIVTCSENSKKDIMRYFNVPGQKITVAYLAPHERFRKVNREKAKAFVRQKYKINGPYVLYVGALEMKKNIPTLLKAFAQLIKKGFTLKLVLAGKQGYGYNVIAETMRKLGLKEHVIELGYVPNAYQSDDLVMLYNAAEVFVFPSVYEGFGMPAVEAMKCGCPVVTSNGGSLPEIVGGAGKVVDVFDVGGYASSIKEILESKKTAAAMRKKGFKNAKRFSWKESAKRIIKVYEEL